MAAFMMRGRAGRVLQQFSRLSREKVVFLSGQYESRPAACLCVMRLRYNSSVAPRSGAMSAEKLAASTASGTTITKRSSSSSSTSGETQVIEIEEIDDEFKERFIPLTRRSLIRHIVTQKDFLTEEEQRKFETFALALDSAIVNRYHGLLRELKTLFDPINPDKDTISTRRINKKELLDNEFWLLQKLGGVMACANFHELPRKFVEKSLSIHDARHGVKVSVNPDKYDVMRFWALGKETPEVSVPFVQRMVNTILRRPSPKPIEYFKRVVVAVRLKKDDKLLLKAFKEVPVNALEQLLPDGQIHMSRFDKGIITAASAIAVTGILAKVVTLLAHIHVDWTLLITGVTALVGVQSWTTYKNRHLRYVNDLARTLYFKNIANNRGLLTLLVDRAEDELFKEALLMYTLLLTTRPPSALTRGSSEHLPVELGAISSAILEHKVEDWVQKRTGQHVAYSSTEANHLLTELGLLSKDLEENLHVLPLDAAIRNLPQTPQNLVPRTEDYDLVEGYDKDATYETEDDYKKEEKKRRFFGWF